MTGRCCRSASSLAQLHPQRWMKPAHTCMKNGRTSGEEGGPRSPKMMIGTSNTQLIAMMHMVPSRTDSSSWPEVVEFSQLLGFEIRNRMATMRNHMTCDTTPAIASTGRKSELICHLHPIHVLNQQRLLRPYDDRLTVWQQWAGLRHLLPSHWSAGIDELCQPLGRLAANLMMGSRAVRQLQ